MSKGGPNKRVSKRALAHKKTHPVFKKYHCWRHIRVKESWRKPRGIDSNMRRQFKGAPAMVKVGYKQQLSLRHVHPNGKKHFVITNVKELEMLMMNNLKYAAVVAKGVSARKRKDIVTRAKELKIQVMNASAKLRAEENE
jgi:large subunit ribosomal protein L32e